MNESIYLASTSWRGSLNISNMRIFFSFQEAIYYLNTKFPGEEYWYRIYCFTPGGLPKLIRLATKKIK